MKAEKSSQAGAGVTRDCAVTRGFTLIEMLVVIAIISLLAALVVPLARIATEKMRLARVRGELNNLVTAIETYRMEVGEYPPDNGRLVGIDIRNNYTGYLTNAAMHPLYYELNGCLFTNRANGHFMLMGNYNEYVSANDLRTYFSRDGIRNSARQRTDVPYKGFQLRDSQTEELAIPNKKIMVLSVPVPGPATNMNRFAARGENNPNSIRKFNPWFYDSSTTNRNNRRSFDLWTEIVIGNEKHIIGNFTTNSTGRL